MEQLYRKKGKRYILAGVNDTCLHDGIWLITQNKKRIMNLTYYIGEVTKPVNLNDHAYLQLFCSDLAKYIMNLQTTDSLELVDAKKQLGDWIKGDIQIHGISSYDLSSLILKFLSEKVSNH